jgi:hypothetical protein
VLDIFGLADHIIDRGFHIVAIELATKFYIEAIRAIGRYAEHGVLLIIVITLTKIRHL